MIFLLPVSNDFFHSFHIYTKNIWQFTFLSPGVTEWILIAKRKLNSKMQSSLYFTFQYKKLKKKPDTFKSGIPKTESKIDI